MAGGRLAGSFVIVSHLAFIKFYLPHLQVLFPLLDNVKKLSGQASDAKVDTSGSMLIHHSRNTAQKQWAETQVRTDFDDQQQR